MSQTRVQKVSQRISALSDESPLFMYMRAATRPVEIVLGSTGRAPVDSQSGLVATQSTRYRFLRWVLAYFVLQEEGRVVFSEQPEVDCTSWICVATLIMLHLFAFCQGEFLAGFFDLPEEDRLVDGEQSKPLHLADCVATYILRQLFGVCQGSGISSISSGGQF